MPKLKKSKEYRPPSPYSSPAVLELDIQALRCKNKNLVEAVAKLQQEKAHQQSTITALYEEYFKLNSKFQNLKNIFSTIEATTKSCFPQIQALVDIFTKLLHVCTVGAAVSDFNKDSRTQTVKPHKVNGHVLHNPTITLSRFNDYSGTSSAAHSPNQNSPRNVGNVSNTPPRRSCLQNWNVTERPTTSRGCVSAEDNRSWDQDGVEEGAHRRENSLSLEVDRVPSFRGRNTLNVQSMDVSDAEEDDDDVEIPVEVEDQDNVEGNCSRLSTIQEEDSNINSSISNSPNQRIVAEHIRELGVFIDPVPQHMIDAMRKQLLNSSLNLSASVDSSTNRSSSLYGEPSDSLRDPNLSLQNDTAGSISMTMRNVEELTQANNSSAKQNLMSTENDSSSNSSVVDQTPVNNKVCLARGKFPKSTPDSTQIFEASSIMYSKSWSAVNNVSSVVEASSRCSNLQDSSKTFMETLGLQPASNVQKTSTPMQNSPRRRSRPEKLDCSLERKKNVLSPIMSNITKRKLVSDENKIAKVVLNRMILERRLSNSAVKKIEEVLDSPFITKAADMRRCSREYRKKKKSVGNTEQDVSSPKSSKTSINSEKRRVAQVILNRMSLERRLSGSPIKKVGDVLDSQFITKVSDIRNRCSNEYQKKKKSADDIKLNVKSRRSETENMSYEMDIKPQIIVDIFKMESSPSPNVKKKKKGKENIKIKSSPGKQSTSLRPRRAAQPKNMKEPSLHKKMRRNVD